MEALGKQQRAAAIQTWTYDVMDTLDTLQGLSHETPAGLGNMAASSRKSTLVVQ